MTASRGRAPARGRRRIATRRVGCSVRAKRSGKGNWGGGEVGRPSDVTASFEKCDSVSTLPQCAKGSAKGNDDMGIELKMEVSEDALIATETWLSRDTVPRVLASPILGTCSAFAIVAFKLLRNELADLMGDCQTQLLPTADPEGSAPFLLGPLLAAFGVAWIKNWPLGPGLMRMESLLDDDDDSSTIGSGTLSAFPAIRRTLSAAVSLAGGVSLGPEAPCAEIGAFLGLFGGRNLELKERRMFLASGAAAGVAAAFHAPFAGALYACELVLKKREVNRVSLAVVFLSATVSAAVVTQLEQWVPYGSWSFIDGAFLDVEYTALSLKEFIVLGGLGSMCSITASVIYETMRLTRGTIKRYQVSTLPALLVGGTVTGLFASQYSIVGYGSVSLESVLDGTVGMELGLSGVLAALGLKVIATGVSKGAGFTGGVFAPTLVAGAMVGNVYWYIISMVLHSDTMGSPAYYALLGACAVMGSTCKVPLTALAMLLEFSRSTAMIIPMMATAGVSCILTEHIEQRGDPNV